MPTDKEIKKVFKKKASQNPEKYYAVEYLLKQGFERKQCECNTYFWTVNKKQKKCGDPACSGGYKFINNTPAKTKLDYVQMWQKFSSFFSKLGYKVINRYPVVARWREDQYWVGASIYNFQPHVVSGAVSPPSKSLVVPQTCLRFNDIDNVGITGSHYTCFVMIGQHMFVKKDEWNQNEVFEHIHSWIVVGLGIPNKDITFHEDAWAGGGNFGPCMEFFSRGLELGNQVYMLFETRNDNMSHELEIKVLDMGAGLERQAWFVNGTSTSYETTFPTVCEKLYQITKIKPEPALLKKFLPYSSYLNIDEVDDINAAWKAVAKKLDINVNSLKDKIAPLAALYSVAEHTRTALFAITDGALPSNSGGGYNLRIVIRRMFDLIDKYGWKIDFKELLLLHANYLKPMFPELLAKCDIASKILMLEKQKHLATKNNANKIISSIIKAEKPIKTDTLIQLYLSNGISPETIKEELAKVGKSVSIPDNFYTLISESEKVKIPVKKTSEQIDLSGINETEVLYWKNFNLFECKAEVKKILQNKVVLNRTVFYPLSGGQAHDEGTIANMKVLDAYKIGKHIIYDLGKKPKFKEGEIVTVKIEPKTRLQITQHHTATHIINGACRYVLGDHVWQTGANKTIEKGRLDITHYSSLKDIDIKKIEKKANEIIEQNLPIYSQLLHRDIAERRYGFSIYQGGVVPGKILRIVSIGDFDIEACAGTHLNLTGEAKTIKIIKVSKIQDGVIRLEFVAGNAAADEITKDFTILQEIAVLLDCKINQIPGRAEELFKKWKLVVKKKRREPENFILTSTIETNKSENYILKEVSKILRTQEEHVCKTISRFKSDISKIK